MPGLQKIVKLNIKKILGRETKNHKINKLENRKVLFCRYKIGKNYIFLYPMREIDMQHRYATSECNYFDCSV